MTCAQLLFYFKTRFESKTHKLLFAPLYLKTLRCALGVPITHLDTYGVTAVLTYTKKQMKKQMGVAQN